MGVPWVFQTSVDQHPAPKTTSSISCLEITFVEPGKFVVIAAVLRAQVEEKCLGPDSPPFAWLGSYCCLVFSADDTFHIWLGVPSPEALHCTFTRRAI